MKKNKLRKLDDIINLNGYTIAVLTEDWRQACNELAYQYIILLVGYSDLLDKCQS